MAITEPIKIDSFLKMRAPHVALTPQEKKCIEQAPVAATLSRWRAINTDWEKKLAEAKAWLTPIERLKRHLEQAWDQESAELKHAARRPSSYKDYITFQTNQPAKYFRVKGVDAAKGGYSTEAAPAGWVLRNPQTDAHYLITSPKKGASELFHGDALEDETKYDDAWKTITQVVEIGTNREILSEPDQEELDLSPYAIVQQFAELDVYRAFATTIDSKAADFVTKIQLETLNAADIQALFTQYLAIRMRLKDINFAIEQLSDRAARLGYKLATTDKITNVPKGSLYKTVVKTFKGVAVYHNLLGMSSFFPYFYQRKVNEPVDLDFDIVDAKREALEQSGHAVFILALSERGYEAQTGESLSTILDRCAKEKDFRDKCVLFFPVYEQRLVAGTVLSKYSIVKRPAPGFVSLTYPRVFIEERYNYRLAWLGTELGPLLHSVNLAPGESRKVSISMSRSLERSVQESTTESVDLSQQQSTDLATEMERESRFESERTTNLTWNVQGSGSWGAASASAGASGSTTFTAKDYSRSLQKRMQKAASSISKRYKQEVSSTVATKASVTETETITSEIRNINEGKTLNLSYYQVNNIFYARMYLSEIRLTVFSGDEAIAGTGLLIGTPLSLRGDELQSAVSAITTNLENQSRLNDRTPTTLDAQRGATEREIVVKILNTLYSEYIDPDANSKSISAIRDSDPSVRTIAENLNAEAGKLEPEEWKTVEIALKSLEVLTDQPLRDHEDRLTIPSGAVYLDGDVGNIATTERYAEEMRARALQSKDADIAVRKSEAFLNYARAQAADIAPPILDAEARSAKELLIVLQYPLAAGDWRLTYDGVERGTRRVQGEEATRFYLIFTWETDQDWLRDIQVTRLDLRKAN
jgi:hypothetical protein